MRRFVRCASFLTLVGMLIVSVVSGSNAQDKQITKKDLPVPVLKSFETTYPKAKVNNYAKEVEKGVTYYELETVEGKIKRDLLYKADGTLEEAEENSDEAEAVIPQHLKADESCLSVLDKRAVAKLPDGDLQLLLCVHDDGAVPGNRFPNRIA